LGQHRDSGRRQGDGACGIALTQTPLAEAEAAGRGLATKVGCAGQTAVCLRGLPVSDVIENQSNSPYRYTWRFSIPTAPVEHASSWHLIDNDRARLTTSPNASPPPQRGEISTGEGGQFLTGADRRATVATTPERLGGGRMANARNGRGTVV
jgi:hypothetical protein